MVIVFLQHVGKKKGVKPFLLQLLGIAKHQYLYNSEAHTDRCKHSPLLLIDTIEFGDFRSPSSKSKHFSLCLNV